MTATNASESAQDSTGAPASDETIPASSAEDVTSAAATEPAVDSEAPSAPGDTAAPPAAGDANADGSEAAEPRKPKADRIRELVAEREFWKRQALNGGQPPVKAPDPAPAPAALPDKPPAIEDFEDVNAWAAAVSQYHDKRVEHVVEQKLGKVREHEEVQTAQGQFVAREKEFAAAVPDYAEVVSDPEIAAYVTPQISAVVVRSELGPQMSYHLARPENRNELMRISQLAPAYQLYELGKLEARLQAKPAPAPAKPKPVQQTRAPAPPSPVSGGGSPSVNLEHCDIKDFMAARRGPRKL